MGFPNHIGLGSVPEITPRALCQTVTTVNGREGIRRTFRYSLFLVASAIRGLALSEAHLRV